MKSILYALVALFFVTACSKKNDVIAPSIDSLVGTYDVSRLVVSGSPTPADNQTVIFPRTSGTLTQSARLDVTKLTATTVGIKLAIVTTGSADVVQDIGSVELKGSDLYDGTTKAGTADGSNFNLDIVDGDGSRVQIFSKKR